MNVFLANSWHKKLENNRGKFFVLCVRSRAFLFVFFSSIFVLTGCPLDEKIELKDRMVPVERDADELIFNTSNTDESLRMKVTYPNTLEYRRTDLDGKANDGVLTMFFLEKENADSKYLEIHVLRDFFGADPADEEEMLALLAREAPEEKWFKQSLYPLPGVYRIIGEFDLTKTVYLKRGNLFLRLIYRNITAELTSEKEALLVRNIQVEFK